MDSVRFTRMRLDGVVGIMDAMKRFDQGTTDLDDWVLRARAAAYYFVEKW